MCFVFLLTKFLLFIYHLLFIISIIIVTITITTTGYRNFNEFYADCQKGLKLDVIKRINKVIKNSKVKLKHIGCCCCCGCYMVVVVGRYWLLVVWMILQFVL